MLYGSKRMKLNLAKLMSEISYQFLNETKNNWISLLVSELGFNLFNRDWKIFEARSSRSVDSRDFGSTEYAVGQAESRKKQPRKKKPGKK